MHWLYSPSIMDYLAMMHISYVGPRLSFILVMLIFKISLFKTEKHLFEEVSVLYYFTPLLTLFHPVQPPTEQI